MKIIGVPSRVSLAVVAAVLLLQLSPGLAAGQPDAQQATIQGSRFPGMAVPSTKTTGDRRHGPVEVTFTKWVTTGTFLAGIAGGDVDGRFVLDVGLKRLVCRQRLVLPHVDPDRPEPAGEILRERRVRGVS